MVCNFWKHATKIPISKMIYNIYNVYIIEYLASRKQSFDYYSLCMFKTKLTVK